MTVSAESAEGLVQEVPLRGMRGAIAAAMMASLHGSAQLTLHREIDVGPLLELRRESKARLSINVLVLAAVARVLANRPDVNATLEDGVIRRWGVVNLGFAVAVEDGLLVPVLRQADRMAAGELAQEVTRLTERARARVLVMSDLQDATFTVTNLGSFGIDSFTPIVNLPQVAILGVGRVRDNAMTASLSLDHRALDGAPGAEFLAQLNDVLATPETLMDPPIRLDPPLAV